MQQNTIEYCWKGEINDEKDFKILMIMFVIFIVIIFLPTIILFIIK